MMDIEITGIRSDGGIFRLKERSGTLTRLLIKDERLVSIDLSPLVNCEKLTHIELDNNQLTAIDLSPLSEIDSLTQLWLGNNNLSSIDLSPLRSTPLSTLILDSNSLNAFKLYNLPFRMYSSFWYFP